jgi:hypothetical protein
VGGVFGNYLRAAAASERRRRSRPAVQFALDLGLHTFAEQLAFILDPSDQVIGLCGRRAGKSSAARLLLVKTALERPGTISALVTITRASAKKLYWQALHRLLRQLGVPFDSNATELVIRLGNGSEIWLAGAKDASEIERLRGHAFALVIVDEAGSIRDQVLRALVEDVLQWALVECFGKLRLIGTPPPVPVGYFAERFLGVDEKGREVLGWSRHHWTIYQNAKLPQAAIAAYLEKLKRERGISEQSVTWRREVLGELVYDRDALVLSAFDLVDSVYTPDQLPAGRPAGVILGVDIGWHDPDAIVALARFPQSPDLWVVEEWEQPHRTEEQLGARILESIHRWHPLEVSADTGGGGKKTVEGVSKRIAYTIKAAHKPSVVEQFQRVNDEFRARSAEGKSRLRVPKGGVCAADAVRMRWVPGKTGIEVAKVPHSDALPALSYAYAETDRFWAPPVNKEPDPNRRVDRPPPEPRSH